MLNLLTILSRLRYYDHIQRCADFFYEPFGHCRTNVFRTSRKVFSSAWGDRRTKYPSQEDILEWAKPALPLEETFNDLFLEDFVWAHAVSLHQRLDTLQYHFAAPLVGLLQRGLQDKEQVKQLTLEVEFMVRYAPMVGGRNLELVQVWLAKVGWPAWCLWALS